MKTTYFLHVSGPDGLLKTLARCLSVSDGRRRASTQKNGNAQQRLWIGEYRNGSLVSAYEA